MTDRQSFRHPNRAEAKEAKTAQIPAQSPSDGSNIEIKDTAQLSREGHVSFIYLPLRLKQGEVLRS